MKNIFFGLLLIFCFTACTNNNHSVQTQDDEQKFLNEMKQSMQDSSDAEIVLIRDTTN
ncbi:MAG: hypothetical protein N2449_10245 [Bacteroidales bacterium]|nr:hypothetical protein [Bacteroidales bacterium]